MTARPAAVAGMFYPADRAALERTVLDLLVGFRLVGEVTRNDGRWMETTVRRPYLFHGSIGPSAAVARWEDDRVNWSAPLAMDPVDPDVLYFGTYRVWKSTNGGNSWQSTDFKLDSAAATTASTSAKVPDRRAAKQSGRRLKVQWPSRQYHRAIWVPGGCTRA